MAIAEIYVDPTLTDGTGTGVIGDPFGDIEYAIVQTTFDTTNGTRINVKAGTPTSGLTAPLETSMADTSVSVAWSVTAPALIVIQGYTATAGDGGVGTISGGGSVTIWSSTSTNYNAITFIDMHLTNTGAAPIITTTPTASSFIRCELDTSSATSPFLTGVYTVMIGCYAHTLTGTYGITIGAGFAGWNHINATSAGFGNAFRVSGQAPTVLCHNIVIQNTTNAPGIGVRGATIAFNNSVYHPNAGTASGIAVTQPDPTQSLVFNNLIQGWSGTNGEAIDIHAASASLGVFSNSEYDCFATLVTNSGRGAIMTDWAGVANSGNEALGATPFAAAGTDFSPVNTGNVKEGSNPSDFGNGAI